MPVHAGAGVENFEETHLDIELAKLVAARLRKVNLTRGEES